MPLQTLKLKAGIVKDDTSYSAEGGWADSDKIRFWNGKPEKIGGWNKFTTPQKTATTTLNGAITATSENIELTSTTNFPFSGTITIGNEQITYTGTESNKLTGCTRGANSTTASTHSDGASVSTTITFFGSCRGLISWRDNDGNALMTIGTHTHLYLYKGGLLTDITPVQKTSTTLDDYFSTTNGSPFVNVNIATHGCQVGDRVIFGAFSANNISWSADTEFSVTEIVDSNNFKIKASTNANNTETSIDADNVKYEILLPIGTSTSVSEYGFGTGNWNEPRDAGTTTTTMNDSGGINATDTSVTLTASDAFPTAGTILIGTERIQYTGNNTGTEVLSGLTRGAFSTNAASHSDGVTVTNVEGWGVPFTSGVGIEVDARTWSFDTWGEDLVASVNGQPIITWDASVGTSSRATFINDTTTGDSVCPDTTRGVIVSTPDRHLVTLGAVDPLRVRWASQETTNTWTATSTNTAGSQLLTGGSKIIGAKRTRGQILIWTDTTLHSMTFRGPPYIFGFRELATGCGLGSPNGCVEIGGNVFWIGVNQFFAFDGAVKPLLSTVSNYVFDDFNLNQIEKCVAGLNKQHNEVFWFYPTANSSENNRYVKYNYRENIWDVGTIDRSAWTDAGTFTNNVGASSNGLLYQHEVGTDDDGLPMTSYVQSADIDLGEGEQIMFIDRMIPDATITGTLNSYIKTKKHPADTYTSKGAFAINSSTKRINPRARGRQVSIRFESNNTGDNWRLGATRLDMNPDGER